MDEEKGLPSARYFSLISFLEFTYFSFISENITLFFPPKIDSIPHPPEVIFSNLASEDSMSLLMNSYTSDDLVCDLISNNTSLVSYSYVDLDLARKKFEKASTIILCEHPEFREYTEAIVLAQAKRFRFLRS